MKEEEKKAIEILQEFKKTGYHTLSLKYNEDRIHTNKLIERALETVLNLIETQKAELEKKEKAMNLMAEQLTTPKNEKKWVIEYYTKLAEERKYGKTNNNKL